MCGRGSPARGPAASRNQESRSPAEKGGPHVDSSVCTDLRMDLRDTHPTGERGVPHSWSGGEIWAAGRARSPPGGKRPGKGAEGGVGGTGGYGINELAYGNHSSSGKLRVRVAKDVGRRGRW